MDTAINDWLTFLRDSHSASGIPLAAAGIALMLFGWRTWKFCVVVSFGLIGAAVAACLVGSGPGQWIYAVCGGALLGLAVYHPVKYAISLLGGIIVAGIVYYYLVQLGFEEWTLWMATGAALVAGTAFAAINRRHIVIMVTAFIGAVLLVSGMAAWLMAFPALFNSVKSLASNCMIVLPFVLLVPTVMSSFYQIAEVHRLQAEI